MRTFVFISTDLYCLRHIIIRWRRMQLKNIGFCCISVPVTRLTKTHISQSFRFQFQNYFAISVPLNQISESFVNAIILQNMLTPAKTSNKLILTCWNSSETFWNCAIKLISFSRRGTAFSRENRNMLSCVCVWYTHMLVPRKQFLRLLGKNKNVCGINQAFKITCRIRFINIDMRQILLNITRIDYKRGG